MRALNIDQPEPRPACRPLLQHMLDLFRTGYSDKTISSVSSIMIKPKAKEFLCMGVVPEKNATKSVLMDTMNSHWGSITQSTSTPDAVSDLEPFSLSSVPLLTPSGLSRVQFLAVSQALTLPFFPTYCNSQGGLVRAWSTSFVALLTCSACLNH